MDPWVRKHCAMHVVCATSLVGCYRNIVPRQVHLLIAVNIPIIIRR
ncbi:hypothetical protein Ahy_A08g040946 isoform C [Arachis hypogaea]|uniref:Uncharacterized protein n=1 Tax=Arachis hypogaea TaxID=3818 RepID=A0A445C141_ARAHY|nr:hypothetical protein Ahy_A08g040946 isoform C [Arachis hypogaea]